MKTDFLVQALYITKEVDLGQSLFQAFKRCGARKIVHCKTVSEAVDITVNNKFKAHFVIEDIEEYDSYRQFPSRFINACKRFKPPPPCLGLCEIKNSKDIKNIKSSFFLDYIQKPINESLLDKKIRETFQKSYSYARNGILTDVVESLMSKNEFKKAFAVLTPALAKETNSIAYISLLSKIMIEMKEFSFAEKSVRYILRVEKENLLAKTLLMKILLSTGRVKEANKLERQE